MGYSTKFYGSFALSRPLTMKEANQLTKFADRRHDNDGPVGSYYCDWAPSANGQSIRWNHRAGSFYNADEWLEVLISEFFEPWGIVLNGRVDWNGEEAGDQGAIFVKNNEVKSVDAIVTIPIPPGWEDIGMPRKGANDDDDDDDEDDDER